MNFDWNIFLKAGTKGTIQIKEFRFLKENKCIQHFCFCSLLQQGPETKM